jgi:NitT/TauT family transport system substrate-binding protein
MRVGLAIIAIIAIIVIIVAGAGCSKPAAPPVRVGMALWPPFDVFRIAQSLGYYADAPVQLVDFGSLAENQRAYEAEVIDVLCTTAEYALQLEERSREHHIVLVTDFSNGGDALIARRGIDAFADLKSKRVGFEAGGLGVYVLRRALDRAGMSTRDVVLVPVDLTNQQAAFESGSIDAVVTYEPLRTKLLAKGGRELFSTRDIPGEVVDVLVVRTRLLERRGDVLKKLIDGWFRALDYLEKNPTDAARRVADHQGITAEEYLRSLDGAKLPSLEDNRRLLDGPSSPLIPGLRRLSEVAARNGILKAPLDPAPLLDDQLVRVAHP